MRALGPLWLAGGGLVAGWFAVVPSPASLVGQVTPLPRGEDARQTLSVQFEDLSHRLREPSVPLQPTARNPFRFAEALSPKASEPGVSASSPASSADVTVPARQGFSLSGIAQSETESGIRRTAIIVGEGELFLAAEGEMAGRYRVVRIGAAAVELRDEAAGTGLELRLP